MKIKLGDQVISATGKQGASIYKRSPYGLVKYNKAQAPPIRARQFGSIQAALSNISREWRYLTPSQRLAWDSFAINGFSIPGEANTGQYSGITAFQSCNFNRRILEFPLLLSPVFPVLVNQEMYFNAIPQGNIPTLPVIFYPNAFGIWGGVLYAAPPRTESVLATPNNWKIINVFPNFLPFFDDMAFNYSYYFGDTWRNSLLLKMPLKIDIIDFSSGIVVASRSAFFTIY